MQKCKTPYCSNTSRTRLCEKCYSRIKRDKDPMRYSYLNLKANAKRRGKAFDLTFDQFKEFCYRSDYIAGKGRTKESYSIDRIDNNQGYTVNNIQVLSASQNASKGKKMLVYDWQTREGFVINTKPETTNDEKLIF